MSRSRSAVLGGLLLVSLVFVPAAGAGTSEAAAGQTRPAAPSFPSLPADAPAGTGVTEPCLQELEGVVRCGRYRVWEDREAGSGRTIDLAFVVGEALDPDASRGDAITFFFGGPGTSTTRAAARLVPARRELRRQRDLLLLDFRGAGASGALDCDVPYPGGVESRFGEIFPLDHVRSCRDELSRRARLDLYTTRHNMDDLDEVRAWLGYDALNIVAGSYGTREAQVLLRRHPEIVRTLVLNGVAPLFTAGYVTHARGLQNALEALVAECAADSRCAAAYPELDATVAKVLDTVRRDPPRVTAEGNPVRLGRGELGYALRGLLYGRGAEVPLFLQRAAEGHWQPLADYYLARSGWVGNPGGYAGMHFSVICAEDVSRLDEETIAAETADTFLGDTLIDGYRRVCEIWPHARLEPEFWTPVEADVPTLLLSGSRDPVTPPEGAEAVARHLPNSLHVVVPGGGHGVGGPCIERLQRRLIETGSVEGLDPSCIQARPPTEFVLLPSRAK